MSKDNRAREEILGNLRSALKAVSPSPLAESARFAPRKAGSLDQEIERMRSEVARLSGRTREIRGPGEFAAALAELLQEEGIRTAAFSHHPRYRDYAITAVLERLGVALTPPESDRRTLAECDLGITVADAAIPDTGTSLLRTTKGQPDLVSLLPRVNLVLVAPEALLADMHQAFELAKDDRHFVMVSGCSRTADIEKVLTLGVHGPKSFHVWICS